MTFDLEQQLKNQKNKTMRNLIIVLFLFFILIVGVSGMYLFSPISLSQEERITIPNGYSIIQTGNLLEEKKIITSSLFFRILGQLDSIVIKSGTYSFEGSFGITEVIERLRIGDYGDVYISVTIPEGSTTLQIANILEEKIENFNKNLFIELTQDKEGYLFPDTYQFLPEVSTESVARILINTFNERTEELQKEYTDRTWEDVIIMASILEKEATGNQEEKQIVSGILWKRIDEGKLLQVDAPFQYINGVVDAKDLRVDGPYNTYTRKGLTPTPIGNPGIDSITAALSPISSPYYFYLHAGGQIYYGRTYNDHINNINRYLR